MIGFPAWFDPRDPAIWVLNLANVHTPDGEFGFLVGADGTFTDTAGKVWIGSQLIGPGEDEFAIDGVAPSGTLTFSFFQDPAAPDVVAKMRDLGSDYVNGYPIEFLVQPLRGPQEFHAPSVPPLPVMRRVMRGLTFDLGGAQDRTITLTYESIFENRRRSRRLAYTTVDHGALAGEPDPSLEMMPMSDNQEEKLFG